MLSRGGMVGSASARNQPRIDDLLFVERDLAAGPLGVERDHQRVRERPGLAAEVAHVRRPRAPPPRGSLARRSARGSRRPPRSRRACCKTASGSASPRASRASSPRRTSTMTAGVMRGYASRPHERAAHRALAGDAFGPRRAAAAEAVRHLPSGRADWPCRRGGTAPRRAPGGRCASRAVPPKRAAREGGVRGDGRGDGLRSVDGAQGVPLLGARAEGRRVVVGGQCYALRRRAGARGLAGGSGTSRPRRTSARFLYLRLAARRHR